MDDLPPARVREVEPTLDADVQAAIDALDIISGQMRDALGHLGKIWRRGGHNYAAIKAMRRAGKRARSSVQ